MLESKVQSDKYYYLMKYKYLYNKSNYYSGIGVPEKLFWNRCSRTHISDPKTLLTRTQERWKELTLNGGRRVYKESQRGGCRQNKVEQEKEESCRRKNNNLHRKERRCRRSCHCEWELHGGEGGVWVDGFWRRDVLGLGWCYLIKGNFVISRMLGVEGYKYGSIGFKTLASTVGNQN